MHRIGTALLALTLALTFHPRAHAQLLSAAAEATLTHSGASASLNNEQYGFAVAMSADGSRAVVTTPRYPVGPLPAGTPLATGRAQVWARTGTAWALEFTIAGTADSEQLGWSAAISDDGSVVLVGAPGLGAGGGGHVYRRTGTAWALEQTLTATGTAGGDALGWSAALSPDGTRAVLGAPLDDTAGGVDAGSVVVFVHGATWTQEGRLSASDGATTDHFGTSVAIASVSTGGQQLFVGVPNDSTPRGAGVGTVYIFTRLVSGGGWGELGPLFADDGEAGDALGTSVACSALGDVVIAGAPFDDVGTTLNAGTARVFALHGTTWTSEGTLSVATPTSSVELGTSVSIGADARRAIVGAPREATSGRAHFYLRSGTSWTEDLAVTTPATGSAGAGSAIDLSPDGSRLIVGAPTLSGALPNTGAAYVLRVTAANGTPCGAGRDCTSTYCADGFCCNSLCNRGVGSECRACAGARTGAANGTCAPLTAGTVCSPSSGACDPATACDGTSIACNDPGFAPIGTLCRPSTGPCDAAETCQGGNGCPTDVPAPDGTTCLDANLCNGTETCTAGACGAGAPLACDDGDVCTADACDALTGCGHSPIAGCCHVDADCADLDVCNGAETCVANACVAGTALGCDDGDTCTTDGCDAFTGCTSTPIAGCCHADADCDDGNPCTMDTCAGGGCTNVLACDASGIDAGTLPMPDAGNARDAGSDAAADASTADASSGIDAGAGITTPAGCGCRAGGARGGTGALAGLGLALAALSRRRRAAR